MALKKIILCLLVSTQLQAAHISMSLQKAVDKKLVFVKVASLGGYQGFCVNMVLKNLTKDSLIILVEAGRRLNSLDDQQQDILLVKEESVALKMNEGKSFNLKGYCCQASKHAPSPGSKFSVNTLADSNLVSLARYLNVSKFDANAEQEAVWSLSDKRPTATITAPEDSLLHGLRQKVAMIKGEPIPWYRILSKKINYSNGAIGIVNLNLRGDLVYSNDLANYATLSVVNEKGLPVCEIKSEWLNVSTNQIYKLDLPIKGLAKGKYTIELRTPEKQLAQKEFEL
ncbi:hypothetical protein CNR22_07145 [Sphingobacteriaceae bacterium]|nr:hypothetical protein CNR22_07145 [Sphingobacteriaceae bacterium]